MKKIILSAAILLAGFSAANAQSSASQTASLTLQNTINISITAASGTDFAFDDVNAYENGIINSKASTFLVKSNRPWAVTVRADADNFTGPALAQEMPSSVLGVRLSEGRAFEALSTKDASLTSGERGISSFNIDYNANPGFSYDAGTYTLSVVYTATQQ